MSIVFDINIAPSVTSTGRSLISSAIMCFEMFLGNNVKFNSLNDILIFIDNVRMEAPSWKYNDYEVIGVDGFADINEVFTKLIMNCGYKYIPSYNDMDIVYEILKSCNYIELNRLFYKNNLYCFMDLPVMRNLMIYIYTHMDRVYLSPDDVPESIHKELDILRDYLLEYVFYCHQIFDRMDRNKNMIKKVSLISDTDSSFVSLDAWFNYNISYLQNYDSPILHQRIDVIKQMEKEEKMYEEFWGDKESIPEWFKNPTNKHLGIKPFEVDEWGDPVDPHQFDAIIEEEPELDYNFFSQEIMERDRMINPLITTAQDNAKFSLVNIMCYILSSVINLYMLDFTKQSGSFRGESACRINMKNEFFMTRVMMTDAKKHYATMQVLQEGNYLGSGIPDIKGLDALTKSSTAEDTRKALKKILVNDILTGEVVDQLKIIKDLAILEQKIYNDLRTGSKKYYKPLTVKSIDNYDDPSKIQGIKASLVWDYVKSSDLPGIDVSERNGIDAVKILLDPQSLEAIRYDYPEQYERFMDLISPDRKALYEGRDIKPLLGKGKLSVIGIPKDAEVPKWVIPLIDYHTIINDSLSGFPVSSVGISQMDSRGINYSNVIHL